MKCVGKQERKKFQVGDFICWDFLERMADKKIMLALDNDGGYSITHNSVYNSFAHLFTKLINKMVVLETLDTLKRFKIAFSSFRCFCHTFYKFSCSYHSRMYTEYKTTCCYHPLLVVVPREENR